jgi:hypothetical protein
VTETVKRPSRRQATASIGRPTPELVDELARLLRAGNYLATAAHAVGVDSHDLDAWLAKGARDTRGVYRELYNGVRKARAEGEARHVATIALAASQGDWKASAYLLERQYPERWARASQRETANAEPALPSTSDPFAEVDELATRRGATPRVG